MPTAHRDESFLSLPFQSGLLGVRPRCVNPALRIADCRFRRLDSGLCCGDLRLCRLDALFRLSNVCVL